MNNYKRDGGGYNYSVYISCPRPLIFTPCPSPGQERRPDVNPDFAGIYPWDWVRDDKAFRALSGDSQDALLVAPIIQTFILNRNPVETLDWVDSVCRWDFKRVVPAHLKNDIPAGPSAFQKGLLLSYGRGRAGRPAEASKR